MMTRYIMATVAALAVGPLKEMAPDITVATTPGPDGVQEIDPDGIQGMLVSDGANTVIVVLTPELKAQLVQMLTGVEIATKLPSPTGPPGGLRGI